MFNLSDLSIVNLPLLKEPLSASKVIYYQGTFDPVHEGHLSALTTAMKETEASMAIVHADDGDNPYKPKRAPWKMRSEMVCKAFSHLENVFVSTLSKEELKAKLLERTHVINLIGSDVWPFYSQKKEVPFHGICVSVRDFETPIQQMYWENKVVFFIRPPIQGCSSTKIRNYLKSHPQIYESMPPKLLQNTPLETLDPQVIECIVKNKIYFRSKEDHLKRIKEKIKTYVSSHFFLDTEIQFICLTDIGQGGVSGDLTFSASCREKKYFIKCYARATHLTDFKNELGGIKLLQHLDLGWCQAVSPVFWEVNKANYSHIGLPFVEKNDLSKVFKNLSKYPNEVESLKQEFIAMCFYTGRALAELHSASSSPVDLLRLKHETNKLNEKAFKCLEGSAAKLLPEVCLELRNSFSHACDQFIKNPGVHTYAHGDANHSNFIVDLKTQKVILVDLDRFFSMRSDNGSPLGFPAEDYHRFLDGFPWLNQQYPIPASILFSAQDAFKKGYEIYPSSITPEAHAYFSAYWHLRNL